MALSISSLCQTPPKTLTPIFTLKLKPFSPTLNSHSHSHSQFHFQPIICFAKPQTGSPSVKPNKNNNNNNKRRTKNKGPTKELTMDTLERESLERESNTKSKRSEAYVPLPLPKPPAGFVVDNQGRVLMVAPHRIATIVDPTNNLPLECMIRRVFTNSRGDGCMLLCPVDTPVQILKSTNMEGWSAVSDDEVESLLPTAAYALAKIHMHLVYSGFCYTVRGGFCFSEDNIFDFRSDDGEEVDGVPAEGVEITCFNLDGAHYMIYTPSDPLLFVVVKDENGQLQIADDDLLDDPAIVSAIDEETEFNALVEEEAALLDSVFGIDR